ncbi:MAG: M6 family metalloprotease domain-containing protein, partial [Ignavibacteriales bacterium]|nr:M6 family metalloprotease domain-containing protein [Ignavibacteriales bacterium]
MKGASNSGGALIDIGVFAHEFGHIFGLPDLYDTDNTSEGIGNWCLMAGGAYGGNGQSAQSPSHMSAWCKQALGWVIPKVIDSLRTNFSISPSESSPDVLKIWKHGAATSKEYFLIENRQLVSFDQYLPQDGVLIYHVDDNVGSNTNENHYKVDVEQADGRRDLNRKINRGDAGDPFPGITNNKYWGVNTNPNSNSYSAGSTYIFLKNITKSGDKYIFDIDNGTEPNLAINAVAAAETGMQNGRVEPGETGSVMLTATNLGASGYDSNMVRIRFSDTSIVILKPLLKFSLTAGQSTIIRFDSVFRVPDVFVPRMVYLHYSANSGRNMFSDSVKLVIGIPKTIIISVAEKPEFGAYYAGSLDSHSVFYEEVFNNEVLFLSQRNTVIILSGKNKDTLFAANEIDSLAAFVENGGKLLLSGQNIGEFLHLKFPDFLHSIVGVNWIKNEWVFARTAYKVANDFMGEKLIRLKFFGGDGASNETTPDVFYPVSSAFHPSLSYRTDSVECAGGWIKNNKGGKVFILGFGFESINNNESAITRNQTMGHILDWFNGITTLDKPVTSETDFHVFQNYPNPFNPSTTIMFTIAERSDVVVSVYNSLGQVVVRFTEWSHGFCIKGFEIKVLSNSSI